MLSGSLVSFEIRGWLSSGLVLLLKFSSGFRAACSLFSISLVSFEILESLPSGLVLVLEFFSSFRAVCSSSNSLVSFERFVHFSQVS